MDECEIHVQAFLGHLAHPKDSPVKARVAPDLGLEHCRFTEW